MDYKRIIAEQALRIEQLENMLAIALRRISDLEKQLQQNSKNSHRPPSSDGPKKKPALPRKGGKKGGQKGHKGGTLQMVAEPDQTQVCKPDRCSCGKRLLRQATDLHAVRQVFDIPDPKLVVTQYEQMGCSCPSCGQYNLGSFPEGVRAPVQYGSGVQALVSMLSVKCQLSYQNISELFEDLYGQPINAATLQQAVHRSSEAVEGVEKQIKINLMTATVLNADETGVRIAGKRSWMHVLCNDVFTFLYPDQSRGRKALQFNIRELFNYQGTIIHDCFASYWAVSKAKHGLCGAHLLRELTALMEQQSPWASKMHTLLFELYTNKQQGKLITHRHKAWRQYDEICRLADRIEPPPEKRPRGKPKKTKGRNLLDRFVKYKKEVLRFAMQQEVPFTNNQAERDLRPVKGKQKIAGCFRTFQGAMRYARLQGVFSTWRKQGYSIFREMKLILEGNDFQFQRLDT